MSQSLFWNLLAKKLSGEASADELQELEKLLRENPQWAYQVEHLEKIWQGKKEKSTYESELAFELHLNKLKGSNIDFPETDAPAELPEFGESSGRKRRMIFFTSIAATLLILAGYFLLFNPNRKPTLIADKNSEVSSPLRSKTKLVLPDSSVVWLNAGSKLIYNEHFGVSNRNTVLIGEAFFDVKKSTIPFVIHANSVQIKVLGTAFNVRSYPDENTTETSLVRGRVEITLDKRPGEKFILKPNEKLIVANDQNETGTQVQRKEPIVELRGLTRTSDSTIVETSWVDNKLSFQDESFRGLAKKMERWFGVTIEFREDEIANERLSGTFTTETIHDALEELRMTTKFHYTIKENYILITQ